MTDEYKLLVCVAVSVVAHVAIERGLQRLPKHVDRPVPHKIDIRVIAPPPPEPEPEPLKPPEPKPPEPKPAVHDAPKTRPVRAPIAAETPKELPPSNAPVVAATTDIPQFGVTMESTSTGGSGPAVPIGNTQTPQAGPGSAAPKPLAAPVAAYEATKMPLPQGRCFGKYTEEAKAAGLEGKVVLDLVVGEDGRARDIHVVEGLGAGLTEAAITALRDCRFSPGEKDGKPIAVRVRGFKISFYLNTND